MPGRLSEPPPPLFFQCFSGWGHGLSGRVRNVELVVDHFATWSMFGVGCNFDLALMSSVRTTPEPTLWSGCKGCSSGWLRPCFG